MDNERYFSGMHEAAMMVMGCIVLVLVSGSGWCQAQTSRQSGEHGAQLVIQLGHASVANSAIFSADGGTVLTASQDGTARLWESATGRELQRFVGHKGIFNSAVFSPGGGSVLIAGGHGEPARLWEKATGKELQRFGKNEAHFAGFSSEGTSILTLSVDGAELIAQLWEARTGKMLMRLGSVGYATSAVFSADDKTVFTMDLQKKTGRLWDIATGREIRHYGPPSNKVFAVDSKTILTISDSGRAYLWEIATGRELRSFNIHSPVIAVFSVDGCTIFTMDDAGTGYLWETATGREIHRFVVENSSVQSAVLSRDGAFVLVNGRRYESSIWEVKTGREVKRFPLGQHNIINPAIFSRDGKSILTASIQGGAYLWDMATGQEVQRFEGPRMGRYRSAAFSADNRTLLSAGAGMQAQLWDIATGRELKRFGRGTFCGVGDFCWVTSAVFSRDGSSLLTTDAHGVTVLWETATGRELKYFFGSRREDVYSDTNPAKSGKLLDSSVFSSDSRYLVIANGHIARLWEIATGLLLRKLKGHEKVITSAVFSPDDKFVLTASDDGTARLWETTAGNELRRFEGHAGSVSSAVFSPDGRSVLTAGADRTVRLWETATGREILRFDGHDDVVTSANFSPDGCHVLTSSFDKTARLWEVATAREVRRFSGHQALIKSAAYSADGHYVLTASDDRTTRIWKAETGKELAMLTNPDDHTWIITTPDGRFDTNNLEEIKGLHWIASDDTMRALPLEIFMRDYYEPRLLPRVLAGEKFAELPRIDQLNRAQPKVEIKDIQVEDAQAGLVTVTVEVTNGKLEIKREGELEIKQSGAYDLRLLRDGQLVAQLPDPAEAASPNELPERELTQWRNRHDLQLHPVTGKKIVTFHGIRLPRKAPFTKVEFSAYAFNVDRVKSMTARAKFEVPKERRLRQARAYIVAIGINGFENDLMTRLSYAANDARELSTELVSKLKSVKNYAETTLPGIKIFETSGLLFGDANVIPVTLITEFGTGDKADEVVVNLATKERIKAVIEKLAGKPVDPARLEGIVNADQLQPARPEDLVIISFSTHGDTDRQGQFYLMPYDLGASAEEGDIRKNAISSEELSAWLRSLDAGELVIVVDACHSAIAVQDDEFKPGPMGSRGLGQLAFDKRMRILAASQRDQDALETDDTQQGLLSYALVHEGLKSNAADLNGDKRIQLSEWLNYGAERVPGLYKDYRQGKLKARAAKRLDEPERKNFISIQQPALFDFARGRDMFIRTITY